MGCLNTYTKSFQPSDPNDIYIKAQARVTGRYFSLPLSFAYSLTKSKGNRFQIFAGVDLIPEFRSGEFKRQVFDLMGSPSSVKLAAMKDTPQTSIGGSVQLLGQYKLSESLFIDLEPSLRYFPNLELPYILRKSLSFSAQLSVKYKL